MSAIRTPFVGKQVTAADYRAEHARARPQPEVPTTVSYKEAGIVPGGQPITSVPGTATTTTTTTTTAVNGVPQQTVTVPGTTTATNVAPVAPIAAHGQWHRKARETRGMKQNEFVITHNHGPEVNPLIEAVTLMANGEMPHNLQLLQTMDTMIQSLQAERNANSAKMSEKGLQISKDTENVLTASKALLIEKNHDEKLQQLFRETKNGGKDVRGVATNVNTAELKDRAKIHPAMKKEGQDTLALAKSLVVEIVNSRDFRSLLLDTLRTFRDVFDTSFGPRTQMLKSDLKSVVTGFENGESFSSLGQRLKTAAKPPKVSAVEGKISENPAELINVTMTPQQKEMLARRFRALLARYGSNEKFRESAVKLFKLMKGLYRQGIDMTKSSTSQESVKGIRSNQNMKLAKNDLIELVERFTGGRKLNTLISQLTAFFNALRNDEMAIQWFKDFKAYALDTFNNPQRIEDDQSLNETMQLIDRGRLIFKAERYESHYKPILKESKKLIKAMKKDPSRRALGDAYTKLARDVVFDKTTNQPSMFALQESLSQMRYVLVPILSKHLECVNIPQIEGYTPKMDFAVRNIVFNGQHLIPENIELTMGTNMNLTLKGEIPDFARTTIMLVIRNLRFSMKDVQFYFHKKTFPRVTDEGLVDVSLGGNGASVFLEFHADVTSGNNFQLVCTRAGCGIDELDIHITRNHHSVLGKMGLGMAKGKIKAAIEKAIAEQLVGNGLKVSDSVNTAIIEAKKKRVARASQLAEKRTLRQKEKERKKEEKRKLKKQEKKLKEKKKTEKDLLKDANLVTAAPSDATRAIPTTAAAPGTHQIVAEETIVTEIAPNVVYVEKKIEYDDRKVVETAVLQDMNTGLPISN